VDGHRGWAEFPVFKSGTAPFYEGRVRNERAFQDDVSVLSTHGQDVLKAIFSSFNDRFGDVFNAQSADALEAVVSLIVVKIEMDTGRGRRAVAWAEA